jgi:glycosyltransferase involved in cell wall biosynthesis
MRLVLVGAAYPLRGGIAQYTALLARALGSRGHDVLVLSFRRQYPSFLFPGKTQKDEGKEMTPVRAVPLLDSINPASWIRAFFWLKSVRPDKVVFKYWMPFFAPCYASLAFLAKTCLRVPVVFLCDNIRPHEAKPGDGLLTRLALRFPDAFIVQSGAVRKELADVRPDAPVAEVPHPLYGIFPPPVSKSRARRMLGIREARVILFFGYIRAYKGLRILLEAMPLILKRLTVRLLVCGEFYEGREDALERIRSLGLGPRVTVVDGFIPNEDVVRYFCACDLVVLPYLSATQSGIVQVAYRYDRPVVATRVGGLPEAVGHGKTGYVVPPGDPGALADAVVRFYAGRKEKAFVRNVRRAKKNYSWDRMAHAVEILDGRRSPPFSNEDSP